MATYYAWSDIRYGGEVEVKKAPGGREIKVVTKRNVVQRGEKVTMKQLGIEKEEWQHLIDTGSVRPYDIPEGASEFVSPTAAFVRNVLNDRGEVDVNKLMELGLSGPPAANPPAEEQAELPVGA